MTDDTRRGFLKAAAVGTAGLVLEVSPRRVRGDAPGGPAAGAIIDAHTHFYDPTRPQGVPWPSKDDAVLYRRVLPEHFRAVAAPCGVSSTIVVEASPWVEDNQWVLDLAAKAPVIIGLVGNLAPAASEFPRRLAPLARNPLFRGIRVNGPTIAALERADHRDALVGLKRLADLDLELDVNGGPEILPDVARLAALLPALRVVINHVANVRNDGKAPPPAWLAGMRSAAARPNVYCKVSGLVENTTRPGGKTPTDVEFYKPLLDPLWDAFGDDRLIFGSNWPVSERFAPYAQVLELVDRYVRARGAISADKFFRRNALAAYRGVRR